MATYPILRADPPRFFHPNLTACVAAILLASACDPGTTTRPPVYPPKDTTEPSGKPYLVHTGMNLAAYPSEAITESLYVADATPGAWRVSLIEAPPGTSLSGNLITYRLPGGLTGPQSVHALASKDTLFLESTWTITAYPAPNRAPTVQAVAMPTWIAAGKTFRTVIHASDPDGDPLRFSIAVGAQPGMSLRDSLLEWTPAAEQAGQAPVYTEINVSDTHGHVAFIFLGIIVLGFDPEPYAAELKVGRVWRIRGYSKSWSSYGSANPDSTYMQRSVTILTNDSESGSFSFRVQDTLTGTRNALLDTTFAAVRREGYDFSAAGLSGMLPFRWPANADTAGITQFRIGDKSWTARREAMVNTCLVGGDDVLHGCGGGEKIYAAGWGLVSLRTEYSVLSEARNSRDDYAVWDVVEP